jgi:hypothetical protein
MRNKKIAYSRYRVPSVSFSSTMHKLSMKEYAIQLRIVYNRPEMAEMFLFSMYGMAGLCLASPVLSNTGTDRGLPISCFGIDVADSIIVIGQRNLEMMRYSLSMAVDLVSVLIKSDPLALCKRLSSNDVDTVNTAFCSAADRINITLMVFSEYKKPAERRGMTL